MVKAHFFAEFEENLRNAFELKLETVMSQWKKKTLAFSTKKVFKCFLSAFRLVLLGTDLTIQMYNINKKNAESRQHKRQKSRIFYFNLTSLNKFKDFPQSVYFFLHTTVCEREMFS